MNHFVPHDSAAMASILQLHSRSHASLLQPHHQLWPHLPHLFCKASMSDMLEECRYSRYGTLVQVTTRDV